MWLSRDVNESQENPDSKPRIFSGSQEINFSNSENSRAHQYQLLRLIEVSPCEPLHTAKLAESTSADLLTSLMARDWQMSSEE